MTRRPSAPFWLAQPSRFAGLTRRDAWLVLAGLAALLLASLLALATPIPAAAGDAAAGRPAEGQTDALLYQTIVETVRHGGGYYPVAAAEMRAGDYPLRPFVTMRLPTLAMVEAALPPFALTLLLYGLVAAVVLAWWSRLTEALSRPPPRMLALLALAAGLVPFVQADLVVFHEIWAGLLVALSLGVWRPDRWLPAVAFGLAAVLIRETAALYLVVMALAAFTGHRRPEAIGWGIAGAVLMLALVAHAHAVAAVVRPLDPASPGWSGRLGFGFFVRTMSVSTGLVLLPAWIAAPVVGLALFGWAAWRSALAARVLALLIGYALVLSVFGRSDTFYWGLLVAPLLLVGLAFVPDAIRDLLATVGDRRRITVKRIVR